MTRVLVTGGAGFLGSHLVDALLERGDEVIALDNLFTGSRRNVEHRFGHPHFELVRGDVCDPFHFEVDQIYHLACPASPKHYQRNPARTIETAVVGTRNALQLARSTGARLMIASTSEIYGDPAVHPQVESYFGNVNPVGPRACYDEGKRCGEALAAAWAEQYGVDVRIARIFNTYGPRMAVGDGRVVSNFCVAALRGAPLTLYGNGSQTRSFCYVDDLIAGFLALMSAAGGASAGVMPFNLGNPEEITIREVAERVLALAVPHGSESKIVEHPLPTDDPTRRRPDVTRAARHLGWAPRVKFSEGLRETFEFFRGIVGK